MVFKGDPYATHQPFLEWYINKTSGDIIEFGIGHGSTGFILELIKGTNRKLLSLENDKKWYDEIVQLYPPNENHEYIFVEDWKEELNKLDKNKYSIVFIDQSPWEARIWTMDYFLDTADYILVHDVDYFPKSGLFGKVLPTLIEIKKNINLEPTFDFSDKFKNWKLYYPKQPWPSKTGPPTLVGTNKELEIFDINL
jgi:hypothetical protein